jgi:hypothetical protein
LSTSSFGTTAKAIIGTLAPTLLTAVLGPFGGIANLVLQKALGTPPGDDKAAEALVLAQDPDTLAKIKQAENDFQVQMKTLGISEEKLRFDDVASARTMEATTKDSTPRVLSYVTVLLAMFAFLGVLSGVIHIPADPQTAIIYGSVLTYLFTECKSIYGYWFGSSSGSNDKSDVIASIAKQPTTTIVAPASSVL